MAPVVPNSRIFGKRLVSLVAAFVLPFVAVMPFLNKAFHVDDPMYVWVAQHIVESPLDPYGFAVNWFGRDQPVYETNQNPPGLPYVLALAGLLAGWSEVSMHLVTAGYASLFCGGVWLLADRFCRYPLLATVFAFLSPVTFTSATSVMTDIPMLALYIWAIFLWVRAAESGLQRFYFLASICIAGSMFNKYFGLTALPLVVVYSLARDRKPGAWLWSLSIPILAAVAYAWWTQRLYGVNLLSGASDAARKLSNDPSFDFMRPRVFIGLGFTGGTLIVVFLLAPMLWRVRALAGWCAGLALMIGLIGTYSETLLYCARSSGWLLWLQIVQYAVFLVAGAQVFVLAANDAIQRRSADAYLLVAWIAGTFVFATFLNWSVTARTLLPLVVPGAIVLVRRIESTVRRHESARPLPVGVLIAVVASCLLSVWVGFGDYVAAGAQRRAALEFSRADAAHAGRYWFEAHYGFHYYMQREGMDYFSDDRQADIRLNDRIVVPKWSSVRANYNPRHARALAELGLQYHNSSWVTIWHPLRNAGFYTSLTGPLPYAIGPAPPDEFEVYQVGNYE